MRLYLRHIPLLLTALLGSLTVNPANAWGFEVHRMIAVLAEQQLICGRLREPHAFHARATAPNLIIEVIKTHYPDEATMFELLRLSECNHVVVFLFMGQKSYGSRYNRIITDDGEPVRLQPVVVLMSGAVVTNGELRPDAVPPQDQADFPRWYKSLCAVLLDRVMRDR